MKPRISPNAIATFRHPRKLAAAVAGCAALAGGAWLFQGPAPAGAAAPAPLKVEEMVPANVRPLKPETALAINRRLPVDAGAVTAASPFRPAFSGDARQRSLDCLTQAIYYEAANEPDAGQKAVAQVVLNRVRHPAYPNSVCGVVYQGSERATGCQFTFTCDGSLRRTPSPARWGRARRVAEAALAGAVFAPVGYATHYHADYVVPYWSPTLLKTAVFGRHIFYRSPGALGRSAFTSRYAGAEPAIAALRRASAETEAPSTAEPQDFGSATLIDFARLDERPSEDKAAEFDKYGLLDYRSGEGTAKPAPAADPAAGTAITSAFAPRARKVLEEAKAALPEPVS